MAEPDSDEVMAQFNQLIEELLGGNLQHRSMFQPWEIGILVDLIRCSPRGVSKRRKILREYQKAVQQHMQAGAQAPLKFSEYMKFATDQHAAGAHGN
jgi:hypothetical protein